MSHCENSDHDGVKEPAVAIISAAPDIYTSRCAYCAGGLMTYLVSVRKPFNVRSTDHPNGCL